MEEYYQHPQVVPHPLWRVGLTIFFKLFYFLRVKGRENIPSKGPFLLASNHQSFLDPLVVGLGAPLPVSFMAWAALFRGPQWFARLIHRFGAFPVDLEKTDPASFRLALEVLRNGYPLVIFPEGGRQDQGTLMDMREGAARLAMHAGAPIVPVRIEGAWAAWPKPRPWPSIFKPIKVTFGPPIPVPGGRLKPAEREAAAKEIMARLRAFLDEPAKALPEPQEAEARD